MANGLVPPVRIELMVLLAIGLDGDLALIAADDELGRTMQDLALQAPRRAPRRNHDG